MQSNDLNQEAEVEIEEVSDDVGADIAASIEKLKTTEPVDAEPAVQEEVVAEQPVEAVKKYEPPASYTPAVKEKWAAIPPEVQAELVKREEDVHKMLTSPTGELALGREMKETIAPYMPIITSEGGTPVTAVRDLLNTAYVLRKGTPEQKLHVVTEVCKQFGVPIEGLSREQEYVDPTISQLQQKIQQLEQFANPDNLFKQLQEKQERSTVQKEADAFALNPENKYFSKVKPFMAAFLGEGVAKDYKEAYDMACNAHPEVRSILEAEKKAAEAEKRKTEIKAKQHAASSIVGSPATAVSNANSNQTDDIESDVRAALRSASGKI